MLPITIRGHIHYGSHLEKYISHQKHFCTNIFNSPAVPDTAYRRDQNASHYAKSLFIFQPPQCFSFIMYLGLSRIKGYLICTTSGNINPVSAVCAMAQVVSHWHLTLEVQVQHQASHCGICGGQRETETGFSPTTVLRFSPVTIIPQMLHTPLIYHWCYMILTAISAVK